VKKLCICLLCLLTCVVSALPCAADTARVWTMNDLGESAQFLPDSQEATFWEWPDLQAGQSRTGTLVLQNTTERTMSVYMNGAWLPFDDRAALTYLNHITLTVKNTDGQMLFHDRYVRLAEWQTEIGELAPQESMTWQVEMHCDFAFDGEPSMPQAITWMFAAVPQGAAPLPVVPPAETPITATILAVAAALVLCGCVALRWKGKSHKNSKKAKKSS